MGSRPKECRWRSWGSDIDQVWSMEHSTPCPCGGQLPQQPDEGRPGLEKLVHGDIQQAKASYAEDVRSSTATGSGALSMTGPATTGVLE